MRTDDAALVPPRAAYRERLTREKARRSLTEFSKYIGRPWYKPARHQELVAKYLHECLRYVETKGREGIGRLMIFEPPRHGKTQQVGIFFPAWAIGKNPDIRLMVVSYGADLAQKSSREVRNIIANERFQAVFGALSSTDQTVSLSDDSRSVSAWDLAAPRRGGMVASGVGGGLIGYGAHLVIIDDPFKNRDEAEREGQRDLVWSWWGSSVRTRLEEGAAVVLMHQRWHPDDLAGRLLQAMVADPKADQWTVLCLPAVALPPDEMAADDEMLRDRMRDGLYLNIEDPLGRAPGEPLWPEKFELEALGGIKATLDKVDMRDWPALYQQMPRRLEGDWFKRAWFQIVDAAPDGQRSRVRYWDKAATPGGGCFTAGVLLSRGADGMVCVEDVVRGQWGGDQCDAVILQTARDDAAKYGNTVLVYHEQEPGSGGVDSALATTRMLAGFPVRSDKVSGSKDTRLGPFQSQCQGGNVRLVRGPWNAAYIDELCAVPKGKYRDQADASGGAFSKLALGGGVFFR